MGTHSRTRGRGSKRTRRHAPSERPPLYAVPVDPDRGAVLREVQSYLRRVPGLFAGVMSVEGVEYLRVVRPGVNRMQWVGLQPGEAVWWIVGGGGAILATVDDPAYAADIIVRGMFA